jgi:hypothetical protein
MRSLGFLRLLRSVLLLTFAAQASRAIKIRVPDTQPTIQEAIDVASNPRILHGKSTLAFTNIGGRMRYHFLSTPQISSACPAAGR